MADLRDKIFGMSSAARDVMRCLFFHGPTWDGDIPSKAGRGELFDLGYATRHQGWSYLTDAGVRFAIDSMVLGDAKEQWERRRK